MSKNRLKSKSATLSLKPASRPKNRTPTLTARPKNKQLNQPQDLKNVHPS